MFHPSIVTILILVDGFLQLDIYCDSIEELECHNTYFSRWFSAIFLCSINDCFKESHNPYFSRWFSAITTNPKEGVAKFSSQSLF